MFEKDMTPINVADGVGFHELINYVKPSYLMTFRGTVTSCMETCYGEKEW